MFKNLGEGNFEGIGRASGSDEILDTRGVGVADLDADGQLDLVLSNNNGPPTIYLNSWEHTGNWLQLSLEGSESNRDAIGAAAKVTLADPVTGATRILTRVVEAGSGFASQRMFPLHFGLGESEVVEIRLAWPSGAVQQLSADDLRSVGGQNQALYLREGGTLQKRSPGRMTLSSLTSGGPDVPIRQ